MRRLNRSASQRSPPFARPLLAALCPPLLSCPLALLRVRSRCTPALFPRRKGLYRSKRLLRNDKRFLFLSRLPLCRSCASPVLTRLGRNPRLLLAALVIPRSPLPAPCPTLQPPQHAHPPSPPTSPCPSQGHQPSHPAVHYQGALLLRRNRVRGMPSGHCVPRLLPMRCFLTTPRPPQGRRCGTSACWTM